MDLDELAAGFALERLGRSPARYDEAQLLHWQTEAVARADAATLWNWLGTAQKHVPVERRNEFIDAVRPNIRLPRDACEWADRLFGPTLALDEAARTVIGQAGPAFFQHALAAYAAHGAAYQPMVDALKVAAGVKGKALFMPLRAALTGLTHGPELARILALMPPDLVRRRLQAWY
jgi:glutamyl-tRNA synthetase